jgi:hypothetical protein
MLPLNIEIQDGKHRASEKIFCNEAGACVTR